MNMGSIIFFFFWLMAAMSAIYLVITKNLLHAIVALLIILLSIAAIFVLTGAEFLAITQVLVYAGGVVALMIFGIMLTQPIRGAALKVIHQYRAVSLCFGSAFLFLLVMIAQSKSNGTVVPKILPIKQIGTTLITEYAWPFELSGILLLVSLIGAAFAATAHHSNRS